MAGSVIEPTRRAPGDGQPGCSGRVGGRRIVVLWWRGNVLDEVDEFDHEIGSAGIDGKQVLGGQAVKVADEAAAEPAQGDEEAVGNAKGG